MGRTGTKRVGSRRRTFLGGDWESCDPPATEGGDDAPDNFRECAGGEGELAREWPAMEWGLCAVWSGLQDRAIRGGGSLARVRHREVGAQMDMGRRWTGLFAGGRGRAPVVNEGLAGGDRMGNGVVCG